MVTHGFVDWSTNGRDWPPVTEPGTVPLDSLPGGLPGQRREPVPAPLRRPDGASAWVTIFTEFRPGRAFVYGAGVGALVRAAVGPDHVWHQGGILVDSGVVGDLAAYCQANRIRLVITPNRPSWLRGQP